MPTSGLKSDTIADDFEGPAGYAPAQIAGAYGINNVIFGNGIMGNGAGQTIAVTDAGDYPGFVNSTDPNFDASALHIFDQQFGLPDPPSFTSTTCWAKPARCRRQDRVGASRSRSTSNGPTPWLPTPISTWSRPVSSST